MPDRMERSPCHKHVLLNPMNAPDINNSERPEDALAEKHISPTDNLKSRDASASKKSCAITIFVSLLFPPLSLGKVVQIKCARGM